MARCILLVWLVGGLVGCGDHEPTTITTRADVERFARFTLPASATGLECRTMKGIDQLTFGRFEIPEAELPQFLKTLPKGCIVEPATAPFRDDLTEPWWQPNTLRNPQSAQWSEPGFSGNLHVGQGATAGWMVVYFFNYTT